MNKKSKKKEPEFKTNNLIVALVIISLLVGGLSGGVMGYLAGFYSIKYNNLDIQKIENRIIRNLEVRQTVEESATTRAVEKSAPAVVSIIISKDLTKYYNSTGPDIFPFDDYFEFGFPEYSAPKDGKQDIGVGTGFIVDGDRGLILTNKHVVDDPEADYTVITSDGKKYNAQVLARDTINDLAVIQIEAIGLPSIEFSDSNNLKIGQTVIAIGFTLGEFKNTVTKGIISGIGRHIVADSPRGGEALEDVIQTDAAINLGNSGGPLLDLAGRVIGVNTAISGEGQSVGFAIPSNEAKFIFESVRDNGKITRGFLGVRYIQINEMIAQSNSLDINYGALIVKGRNISNLAVVPGSPADKAGLVENDIILEVNGQKIDKDHSLMRAIGRNKPGAEVELKILHEGEERIIKVILEENKL
jgi:serine protease Do